MSTRIVGWVISFASTFLIVLVVTKWPWVRARLGWLFQWGGPELFGLRFPASREGALLGLTMGLILGVTAVVQESDPLLAKRLATILVALLLVAIPMGIRDYRLSRLAERPTKTKNKKPQHPTA